MNPIDIARASGGIDVEIPTIELKSEAWSESMFLCSGFFDQACRDENGRSITFQACGMDAALPKKSNIGSQVLGIAVDNVRAEAQKRINLAKSAGKKVFIVYRVFMDSDRSYPAEAPMSMEVLSYNASGTKIELQCGYFSLINSSWPRRQYTAEFSPGIKYIT